MNSCCYLCKTKLTENDFVFCKMKCDHVLCQTCFTIKTINNTLTCGVCGEFTENIISVIGNNLIITTPMPAICTHTIDKQYDQWMEIWNELTKDQKETK